MRKIVKTKWQNRLKDGVWTILIFSIATGLCSILRCIDEGDIYIPMLFILAVLVISRVTTGYAYGIFAAVMGVFFVNYVFTYPYFQFNFTISGYPLTFITMMAASLITSTLTSQIKAQEALRVETEKEKMRANLLRAVSHDLRTPLTSIVGVISAIIENDDVIKKEERLKLLQEAREDAKWLINMVENLLLVTRVSTEGARLCTQSELVEEVIEESVQKFKKYFPDQQIVVEVPMEVLMIPMDATLIEQVIGNMLENAVIHGKGEKPIELTVSMQGKAVYFYIRDYGKGITEREMPHLFEDYFYHAPAVEEDTKKNMGIGLSVCKTIIEAHHGKIGIKNMSGGGAAFWFSLPMQEAKEKFEIVRESGGVDV